LKRGWRVLLCLAAGGFAACGAPHPAATDVPARAPAASAPQPAPRFATSADGVRIAWRSVGHGEPAIVLVHGWAADSSIWRAQLEVLATRFSVVTLDLAGQGASGGNRQSWTLPNFAQDVAAVVAGVPNAQVILVGHGLGGPVALQAAPLIGARLRGIIGVETFRGLGQAPLLSSQLEQYLQPFRTDFGGALHQYVTGTLFRPRADPAVVRTVADLMAQTAPERGVAALAELNRFDYATALPAVKAPMVVIDSDLGGAVDEARLHRAMAQLRIITLSGADSFPMLDDARRFNRALLLAIDSLAAH